MVDGKLDVKATLHTKTTHRTLWILPFVTSGQALSSGSFSTFVSYNLTTLTTLTTPYQNHLLNSQFLILPLNSFISHHNLITRFTSRYVVRERCISNAVRYLLA